MKRRDSLALLLCVICAALALLAASTCSPLYAASFWPDTNLYFTIGRGMVQGLAPYRDLFDHKGPLLFLIYAAAAGLCDTGMIGVCLLEVLSLTAALFIGYKTVCLYGEGHLTLLAIPMQAAAVCCSRAFTQGGSAEEFCLPALALGLYAALRLLGFGRTCAHPGRLLAAFGAATGWVFLIKYTDCGLFFGLGTCLLAGALCSGGLRAGLRAAAAMLGGFVLMLLPVLAYLLAAGALEACIDAYFVQNLSSYSGQAMSLPGHILNALAYLRTQSAANPFVAVLACTGCVFCAAEALARRRGLAATLCAPLGAGLLLLLCYWGEMAHPYYALVFAALCPLGLCPLGLLAPRIRLHRSVSAALCAAAAAAVLPVCLTLCQAAPLRAVRREDMPQTVFAQIMRGEEAPTLLDLTSLDEGFYVAAGIVPTCRYFADNNLDTPEKREAIEGYLSGRETQFVVTCWRSVEEYGYELVAQMDGVCDLGSIRPYRLYRRTDMGKGRN